MAFLKGVWVLHQISILSLVLEMAHKSTLKTSFAIVTTFKTIGKELLKVIEICDRQIDLLFQGYPPIRKQLLWDHYEQDHF